MGNLLSANFTPGHARDAGEVRNRDEIGEARGLEERAARLALVVAVLEEEPAASFEMVGGSRDDGADRVEAVGASVGERRARLEAQVALREVRIARGDVGRI